VNFRTPVKECEVFLSEDFRGGTAKGLEPDSGFVSCCFLEFERERERENESE
jgi:hypothetical protein